MTDQDHSFSAMVGSQVLFENDRVRVWEMTLDPGEECVFHQHHHDHVILYSQTATMRAQELGDADWGITQETEPGFVLYRTVGSRQPLKPHRLKNISDHPVVHYIFELLETSPVSDSAPWVHNGRGRFITPADER